ncbi:MAG: DUF1540 domain-containing protein [Clostridia bacterium]|nr:DUF1540 domain-containing protein [Clostridia bacterium]
MKNYSIKCDVTKCQHNADGCNCNLDTIKVTCCCGEQCTCCGSYHERESY